MTQSLTLKQEMNIKYLRRICKLYSKFMRTIWHDFNIIIEDGEVWIVWYQIIKMKDVDGSDMKVPNQSYKHFPIKELPKYIREYKAKVNDEFKNRHTNERLINERKGVE